VESRSEGLHAFAGTLVLRPTPKRSRQPEWSLPRVAEPAPGPGLPSGDRQRRAKPRAGDPEVMAAARCGYSRLHPRGVAGMSWLCSSAHRLPLAG
jgi:hypothetical protein